MKWLAIIGVAAVLALAVSAYTLTAAGGGHDPRDVVTTEQTADNEADDGNDEQAGDNEAGDGNDEQPDDNQSDGP